MQGEPYLDREERKAARQAEQQVIHQRRAFLARVQFQLKRRAFLARVQFQLKRRAQQVELARPAEPRRFVDQ